MFSFALCMIEVRTPTKEMYEKCVIGCITRLNLCERGYRGVLIMSPHYHQQLPTLPTEIVMTGDGGGDDGTMGFGSFVLETAAEPIMVVMLV